MRALIQSLLAAAIIALPAHGTANPLPSSVDPAPVLAPNHAPAADGCAEALAQVAVVYAWHVSSFLFCPTGLCIPLIEATGYALLLSAAHALTVCAI